MDEVAVKPPGDLAAVAVKLYEKKKWWLEWLECLKILLP